MRGLLFAFAILGAPLAAPPAFAQSPPIITENPGQYVRDVSLLMSRTGAGALRDVYTRLFNSSALPANIESALITYERAIDGSSAVLGRVVEDTALADTFRSIYTYHYFGGNAWLFTRFDFVRISNSEWAVSAVSFSSEWSSVALQPTPGFTSHTR